MSRKSVLSFTQAALAAVSLMACSSKDAALPSGSDTDANYAIVWALLGEDTDTTYVSLLASLDDVQIDPAKALEVPGRASVAAHDGRLFVGNPEDSTITRYSIARGGKFERDGVVSFANEGIADFGLYIDDWGNTFVSEHKAYLSNSSAFTVVWDPATLEITGRIEQPELAREAPLTFDGSPGVVRGNRLYRTFFWKDWDAYETFPEQYLAVFDTDNDTLLDLLPETRCPGMNNNVSRDENGNLYFSNWVYNVTETLARDAPKSCALRLNAGEERFDAEWQLFFSDLAEGREGAGLTYLRDSQATFASFHDERVTIDRDTDLSELALSENWRIWRVDLDTREAEPFERVDWLAGGYSVVHVADRTFLMVPGAGYAKTTVHELDDSGSAHERFEIPGDSYQILGLHQ